MTADTTEMPIRHHGEISFSPANAQLPTRLLALDILRAVAVLLVIGRHFPPPDLAPAIFHLWTRGGWIGVDLFFVLSGFLVSGLLFREYKQTGTVRVGKFLVRRAFKIYPAFYVMLATTLCLLSIASHPQIPSMAIAGELLFLQNYVGRLWYHTWSLAVEEHFYLLVALLVSCVIRSNSPRGPFQALPWGFLILAIACLFLRINAARGNPPDVFALYQTHFRLDSLGFGMLLAYCWHFHHELFATRLRPIRWGLIATGVCLLSPAFIWKVESNPWIQTGGLTLFYVASGCILSGVMLCRVPRNPVTHLFAFIGAHSYSIYLWHMASIFWFVPILQILLRTRLTFGTRLLLTVVTSVIVGVAFARIIEFPALRLRDRWFPSQSGTSEATSVPGGAQLIGQSSPFNRLPAREVVQEVAG